MNAAGSRIISTYKSLNVATHERSYLTSVEQDPHGQGQFYKIECTWWLSYCCHFTSHPLYHCDTILMIFDTRPPQCPDSSASVCNNVLQQTTKGNRPRNEACGAHHTSSLTLASIPCFRREDTVFVSPFSDAFNNTCRSWKLDRAEYVSHTHTHIRIIQKFIDFYWHGMCNDNKTNEISGYHQSSAACCDLGMTLSCSVLWG